jgi:hypothetical protein
MQYEMSIRQRQVRDMFLFLCHAEVGDYMMVAYIARPSAGLSDIAVAVRLTVEVVSESPEFRPIASLHHPRMFR